MLLHEYCGEKYKTKVSVIDFRPKRASSGSARVEAAGGCLNTKKERYIYINGTPAVFPAFLGVFLVLGGACFAQVNYVPKYSSTTGNLTDSLIYDNGTFVGIGTTNPTPGPTSLLTLQGSNPTLAINNYIVNAGDSPNLNFYSAHGSATAPASTQIGENLGQIGGTGYTGTGFPGSKAKITFLSTENCGAANNGAAMTFGTTLNGTTSRVERMRIDNTGYIGIATTTPGNGNSGASATPSILEVNGNIILTNGSKGAITFQDGSVQSSAYTGTLCGGDYAESVGVSGEKTQYEPGDILVIDSSKGESFTRSATPYSTVVAGIYSTKPGVVGRRTTDPAIARNEIPMAMIGIVPTKVSAENGAIKTGDLLVTSGTPGYAMKGTDRSQMLGAVVGKALGSLDTGKGVINVLVTLQ